MKESRVRAFFELADIPVSKLHRLENEYWPDSYVELRQKNPWWLVMTPFGPIKIGNRKRVISIDWEDTPARIVVTEEEVTKGPHYVHAWGAVKCLEYLYRLAQELHRISPLPKVEESAG